MTFLVIIILWITQRCYFFLITCRKWLCKRQITQLKYIWKRHARTKILFSLTEINSAEIYIFRMWLEGRISRKYLIYFVLRNLCCKYVIGIIFLNNKKNESLEDVISFLFIFCAYISLYVSRMFAEKGISRTGEDDGQNIVMEAPSYFIGKKRIE